MKSINALKTTEKHSLLIFIWHQPEDREFASKLTEALRFCGFVTKSSGEIKQRDEPSFTSDWQMARSKCAIFILSDAAVKSPDLQTEAEKVMRNKDAILIPAYLDSSIKPNLPMILQYLRPIEFFQDFSQAFDDLLGEINRKISGEQIFQSKTDQTLARPLRWVIEHFRRYLTLSPLSFSWQITVENLIVSLAITGFIYLIWQPPPRTNLENITANTYLWSIVILSPILETIFLQAIPVAISRILGFKFIGQIIFSIIPFAVLHFSRSVGAGIGAGIIGGFYSAFTYVHWQTKSTWKAFWVTAFSHCLYNLALFAMLIGEF